VFRARSCIQIAVNPVDFKSVVTLVQTRSGTKCDLPSAGIGLCSDVNTAFLHKLIFIQVIKKSLYLELNSRTHFPSRKNDNLMLVEITEAQLLDWLSFC
jgi:hypothetical protein